MSLEKKIIELKEKCSVYNTSYFLIFIAGVLIQIPQRNESPYLENLMSPLRQLFYLGILNSQTTSNKNIEKIEDKDWHKITKLLGEIESEYYKLLGGTLGGENQSKERIEQTMATMPTFMNYYFNGPLSYQEQEIERIEEVFKEFEPKLIEKHGITLSDLIVFYDFTNDIIEENLNRAVNFLDKEKWQKFTKSCIAKGIEDPKDWIKEDPEQFSAFLEFNNNPGSFLKIETDKIEFKNISKRNFIKILNLFCLKIQPKKEITYYTEDNDLMDFPFIKISETEFLPFYLKQFLNSAYTFLFKFSSEINSIKALKKRDDFVEIKTYNLFLDFFKKGAHYYTNYTIDNNKSEQDILVIYKNNALIIEVKAGSFRAPMREPNRAYKKLSSDFKKIIQNAYEQTLRVKNAFFENDILEIKNEKKQLLHKLNTRKYRDNLYSIIITFDRFGCIQTNLEPLLKIDNDDNYPWSINLDDFEAFLLSLKKEKNPVSEFFKYLKARENFHGHLICGDELELCGAFIQNKNKYLEMSDTEEIVFTHPELSDTIENIYFKGMGFKNERNLERKQDDTIRALYEKN